MKRHELFELPGHIGLLALGQPWMTEAHLADLLTACQLGIDIATDDDMRQLCILGRDMLINRVADIEQIRHVVGQVVQWVSTQPNQKIYDAAKRRLREVNEQERILRNRDRCDLQTTS